MFNFFFPKSVASITASLTTMVKELETHAEQKAHEAVLHLEQSDRFQAMAALAHEEIAKAKAIMEKVGSLLS